MRLRNSGTILQKGIVIVSYKNNLFLWPKLMFEHHETLEFYVCSLSGKDYLKSYVMCLKCARHPNICAFVRWEAALRPPLVTIYSNSEMIGTELTCAPRMTGYLRTCPIGRVALTLLTHTVLRLKRLLKVHLCVSAVLVPEQINTRPTIFPGLMFSFRMSLEIRMWRMKGTVFPPRIQMAIYLYTRLLRKVTP